MRNWILSILCIILHLQLSNEYTIEKNGNNEKSHKIADIHYASSAGHKSTFLLNPSSTCSEDQFLVIMICSAIENYEQRQAIRSTWGRTKDMSSHRVLFLLGNPVTFNDKMKVIGESEKFGDVIQTNLTDTYGNLTLKSLAMLQWMLSYCNQVKFLLKADDDMFLNVPLVLRDLQNTVHTRFIMGDIIAGAKPMSDNTSKWYTPNKVYSANTYPKYVSGSAYVISGDAIRTLYETALQATPFWIEDVYITGICAEKANVQLISNSRFNYRKVSPDPCHLRHVITGHRMTPDLLRKVWRTLHEPIDC